MPTVRLRDCCLLFDACDDIISAFGGPSSTSIEPAFKIVPSLAPLAKLIHISLKLFYAGAHCVSHWPCRTVIGGHLLEAARTRKWRLQHTTNPVFVVTAAPPLLHSVSDN